MALAASDGNLNLMPLILTEEETASTIKSLSNENHFEYEILDMTLQYF